jgi:hypothetical protein
MIHCKHNKVSMTKDKVKGKILALKLKNELLRDKLKRASRLLIYIGIANLIFGLWQVSTFIGGIFIVCTSIVLVMLGILSRNNPLVPLIIALVLLSASYVIDFINQEQIGFFSTTIRFVFLGLLASGIYHCLAADKVLAKYNRLDKPIQK